MAKAFFAALKVKLLHRQTWPTRRAAQVAIFDYIEIWYNRRRRHSTLGSISPTVYEETHDRATAA